MAQEDIKQRLESIIPEPEYIFGFADLAGLLSLKYKSYDYGIVVGKRLDDKIINSIESGPNIDYYHLYNETNQNLSMLIDHISGEMESLGVSTIVIEPTVHDRDLNERYLKELKYDFSHKMAATRAGLGWIGKTDLFISLKFGPRLRLATVLIDHPVPPLTSPVNESKCGKCNLCVERCPAGAASGALWNIDIHRDEFFNPFKCREKCLELSRKNMNIDESLCGICISVCPMGKRKNVD